jgi:mannitol/fructose-specific phosphotransferase system IIA component (Ntr-type)
VDILFLMICPTVHDHLQLLARLASVLRQGSFRKLLSQRPDLETLVAAIRGEERALFEEEDA